MSPLSLSRSYKQTDANRGLLFYKLSFDLTECNDNMRVLSIFCFQMCIIFIIGCFVFVYVYPFILAR